MGNLWVFGDNSSSIFGGTKERRYYHYFKFRSGSFPKSWSELLSKKLDLKLKNYAIEGQTNYDVFEWFIKLFPNIRQGDIVIIGWADQQRFRVVNPTTNEFVSVRPEGIEHIGSPTGILNTISTTSFEQIIDNRKLDPWKNEIYNWEEHIKYLSELVGFKVFFWTFNETQQKPHYISKNKFRDHLIELGAEDITMETNGVLIDKHFGEVGHIVQSEYFFKYITSYE